MSAALLEPFPRVPLGHLPTPLEPAPRLAAALGASRLWVKRDDCTGLAAGGNKTRKLEYLMADARARGCDAVVTAGGVQSNHARQTAAAAARLGMACHLVLEELDVDASEEYRHGGNVLLERLLGARVRRVPGGADVDAAMAGLAAELEASGRRPYLIPVGGSNALGALGYARCALELLAQADALGIDIDCIVHATGSAGTQAGLLAGLHVCERPVAVLGFCVSRAADEQEEKVRALAAETIALLGCRRPLPRDRVRADASQVGKGYGHPTQAALAAIALAAHSEGLLLDPVYTGKAMAGLAAALGAQEIAGDAAVVFLHTGGAPALFAYRRQLEEAEPGAGAT
ncbi:MAG: D-cysteine desulfhydrase [Gammaproteobacteria bacterium]|nr:D-cysteine desulfhydrase [Gammaproteobacteria bacterium]